MAPGPGVSNAQSELSETEVQEVLKRAGIEE